MKAHYVRDLREGAKVDDLFVLQSRDIRSARTGEPYLALELRDNSGTIPGVRFRPTAIEESLPVGSVIRARGSVANYRGVRRIAAESLDPVDTYDPADMLPAGTRDRSELLEELRALLRSIKDGRIRAVVRSVYGAPGFIDAFATCPAGMGRHHAYVGGLLEHTVAVAKLCMTLAAAYPQADADLLLAAALLHDIGKTEELAYSTALDYTDAGRLLGHVVLGERIVSRAIASQPRPLDDAVAMRLTHAIVAHHGTHEWGAPRCPSTIEALLLHHADNLDAQAAAFLGATISAAVLGQEWTDSANPLGRRLAVPAPPRREQKRDCA